MISSAEREGVARLLDACEVQTRSAAHDGWSPELPYRGATGARAHPQRTLEERPPTHGPPPGAAALTFRLSTVPAIEAPPTLLADLYRIRWRAALGFKEWTSLLGLADLRARDPGLARCSLLATLLAALLADVRSRAPRDFSVGGSCQLADATEPLAMVPLGR